MQTLASLLSLAAMGVNSIWKPMVAMVAFGIAGIILMLIGYKLFDLITPKIDVQKELAERQNVAVAIVVAAVILGVAFIAIAAMIL
jgi:uncharacterized membrane protein YjfL (UPF0719 family)